MKQPEGMPSTKMTSSRRGRDAKTTVLEKHPVKSGFFTKKVPKGKG